MSIDVAKVRQETPGCRHVLHFNNAGASLMPSAVLGAVTGHLRLEAEIGGYEAAEAARDDLESVYHAIGDVLGCSPDEIAVTDSATRAWNMGFYGLRLSEGDRILTTQASYASNYIAFLHRVRRDGVEIDVAPSEGSGQVDVGALERLIGLKTRLIALSHVPTNGGLINPASDVGTVARAHGIPYLLDACQSVGQMPVSVDAIGCDMLSAAGRKFLRGPRGTGFLYVRSNFLHRLDPPMPDLFSAEWTGPRSYALRPDARRFELWESNKAAVIGLGTAARYALDIGLERTWERVTRLAELLRGRLDSVPGTMLRDIGRTQCGIVSFEAANRNAAAIKARLRGQSINVSVSGPGSTLLDAEARSLPPLLRASVHYYNTEEEIDRFVDAVETELT